MTSEILSMDMIRIGAFAITLCLLVQLLRQSQAVFAFTCTVSACIVILLYTAGQANGLIKWFQDISDSFSAAAAVYVLRAVGIALISQFVQACCRDINLTALAFAVDAAGRILIAAEILPLLRQVFTVIIQILQ